jgi:hypothetical protein
MKISHRYRKFIILSLILVSASQFSVLLATTRLHATVESYTESLQSRTFLRLPLSLPSHAASRSTFFLSWCPSPLVVQASSVD